MPPDMAISMRHTKLKAEEAALLAGEINKPTWESRNEGIHERVSFEDSIWGFDLAGGIYYKTPLRVTFVKPDSRAEKAGIRPGDRLLKINDLDTSTLTIQEAHDIIIESGIHLKISVTSPDDEEDSYYCYEDPIVDGYDSEEEQRLEEEKAKKRRVCARVSHYWSLQWPWVSKRRLIYRESNCFMVPSKYEDARRDKYPPLPVLRYTDDIVLYNADGNQENKTHIPSLSDVKQRTRKSRKERLENGNAASDVTGETDEPVSYMTDDEEPVKVETPRKSRRSTLQVQRQESKIDADNDEEESPKIEENGEIKENNIDDEDESLVDEAVVHGEDAAEDTEEVNELDENNNNGSNDILSPIPEIIEESNQETEAEVENVTENDNAMEVNSDINEDDVINEVLGKPSDSASRGDDDNILDSILSDEGQNLENSESNNER